MSQTLTISKTFPMSQMDQGVEILAKSFQHDPLMAYLYTDIAKNLYSPTRFYQATIRMGMLYGEVQATPAMDGLAVWVGPGNTDFGFGQLFRTGFITAVLLAGLGAMGRFMKMANYVEEINKPILERPHWHLMFIGVKPSQQGKGIGGALLRSMLERADAENLPCMLESGNERNLYFYRRHGFEIATHDQIPNGGPKFWLMVREPNK